MMKALEHCIGFLEAFAPPSTRMLSEDARYQRFLVPAVLSFCLLEILIYGIFAFFRLHSDSLSVFSFGLALIFVLLLFLSRWFHGTRPLVLSYVAMISSYFVLCVFCFEPSNDIILLSRYALYATIGLLLSGRRFHQALLGIAIFSAACVLVNHNFSSFVLPQGMSDQAFIEALVGSVMLSGFLIMALMWLYNQSCDFSLAYMERQKQWHDSNRLTKEFVNLAGDMNSVMQGPLEDVQNALDAIRGTKDGADGRESLGRIKRASDAIYGIARSFGVLAQDQRGAYNVRINLDELVRYAQIVCQNNFKGLGVELTYESDETPLEFMGPSGRWLLLLVSLLQFMGEQINRTGGRRLHLKRQRKGGEWELELTADGVAPFEFPFDLHQKLKEESTRELLEQTSGKAFLYLLDRWGLKLGSFQTIES